jgi:hypothetical protein
MEHTPWKDGCFHAAGKMSLLALRMTQFRHRMPMASSIRKGAQRSHGYRGRTPAELKVLYLEQGAVIGDRNREEFEQLGQHDVFVQHEAWDVEKHRHAQEWLKEQKASLEREIGRTTTRRRA